MNKRQFLKLENMGFVTHDEGDHCYLVKSVDQNNCQFKIYVRPLVQDYFRIGISDINSEIIDVVELFETKSMTRVTRFIKELLL